MGTYNHTLDPKGRIIIPTKFREQLGDEFIMTLGSDHCIAIYSEEAWKEMLAKLANTPAWSNEEIRMFKRNLYGFATNIELDKQGRALLPNNLREYAMLDKDVLLIGVDDHIEVWNKANWDAYNENFDFNTQAASLSAFNL